MAKLEHKNLFGYGDSEEVYAAFQRDYDRDTHRQEWWRLLLVGAAIGAWLSGHGEFLWLFLGIYAAERALAVYVDNSNRNWAMHVIDWIEARRAGAE